MNRFLALLGKTVVCLWLAGLTLPLLHAAGRADMKTLTPRELLQTLQAKKGAKPLLLYVGPRMLYAQGHIPGSEFIGQGATMEGLQSLRARTGSLPKKTAIV